MTRNRKSRNGRTTTAIVCGALLLAGIPTASFALAGVDNPVSSALIGKFTALTPANVDPRVAALVAGRSGGKAHLLRFTPAGVAEGASRSVTVAVRVGDDEVRAISVRSAIDSAKEKVAGPRNTVSIAPTRYNLGLSHGYQAFAKVPTPELSQPLSDAGIPDLAAFQPSPGAKDKPSRFAARIALDEKIKAGAAPRTIESAGDQTVDLAGSYRVTRNLDVTAGVRYSQDRDRLVPPADSAKQDSQAVYVGTQFRF